MTQPPRTQCVPTQTILDRATVRGQWGELKGGRGKRFHSKKLAPSCGPRKFVQYVRKDQLKRPAMGVTTCRATIATSGKSTGFLRKARSWGWMRMRCSRESSPAVKSRAARAALVERHGPMVLGVCRRLLASPHDVDDAFQATFLVLVQRARTLGDRHRLGPWLHGVAYRVAARARSDAARRRAARAIRGKAGMRHSGRGARLLRRQE